MNLFASWRDACLLHLPVGESARDRAHVRTSQRWLASGHGARAVQLWSVAADKASRDSELLREGRPCGSARGREAAHRVRLSRVLGELKRNSEAAKSERRAGTCLCEPIFAGNWDEAEAALLAVRNALLPARKNPNEDRRAIVGLWLRAASAYDEVGAWKRALELAVEAAQESETGTLAAQAEIAASDYCRHLGRGDSSLRHAERAVALAENANRARTLAAAHANLAQSLLFLERCNDAVAAAERAFACDAESLPAKRALADALAERSREDALELEQNAARVLCERALSIPGAWDATKAEPRRATAHARVLVRLALALYNLGELSACATRAEDALRLRPHELEVTLAAHNTAASGYSTSGAWHESERHHEIALQLARAEGNRETIGWQLAISAGSQFSRGNFDAVWANCEEAAQFSTRAQRLARVFQAEIKRAQGDFAGARQFATLAREAPPLIGATAEAWNQATMTLLLRGLP